MSSDGTATLADRLAAALDKEERLAKAAPGSGVWSAYLEGDDDGWAIESLRRGSILGGEPSATIGDEAMAKHIEANDPDRTLRGVAAHRRILDLHTPVPVDFGDVLACITCGGAPRNGLCDTLLALAEGYGVTAEEER